MHVKIPQEYHHENQNIVVSQNIMIDMVVDNVDLVADLVKA